MRPRYRDLPRWLLIERRDALSQSKECRSRKENFGPNGREQGPRMADRLGPAIRAPDWLNGVRAIISSRKHYNASEDRRPISLRFAFRMLTGFDSSPRLDASTRSALG